MLSSSKTLLRLTWLSVLIWIILLLIQQFLDKDTREEGYPSFHYNVQVQPVKFDIIYNFKANNNSPKLDNKGGLQLDNISNTHRNLGFCKNISRPIESSIKYRNKRWQYIIKGTREVYILDAYYDDRGSTPLIRILPIAVVPEKTQPNNDTLYALLWYDDLEFPVSENSPCKANHTTSFWHIGKQQYGMLYHEIVLMRKDKLPTYVSIMSEPCAEPTTYLKLVIPEKPDEPSDNIALCVKAIWGNYTYKEAPYFVNWMETLRIYGLSKVYMYSSGLYLTDNIIKRIFDHYKNSGFLYLEFLHNNLYETDEITMNKAISQALVLPVINDCFYRHMHKYSFMLHHDTDEILIPRQHQSYHKLINDFVLKNKNYENYESLIARSAFFYTYYEPSHPQFPDYMVFLRNGYRQPVEIPGVTWHRGNGVMKSFQNARTCAIMSIHGCKRTVKGTGGRGYGHTFIPSELVLSHHYRDTCKLRSRCDTEHDRRLIDSTILDTNGKKLQTNVEAVLELAGYFEVKH